MTKMKAMSIVLTLARVSMSFAAAILHKRQATTGLATFNNYGGQHNTVCGPKSGVAGTYGAAVADFSGHISPGPCSQTFADYSVCTPDGSFVPSYQKPSCPPYLSNASKGCGACWKVTNQGSMDPHHAIGGVGSSVVVQIIDACPAYSAENYCKSLVGVAPEGRCGAIGTDALDIDLSAYGDLTGQAYAAGSTPNLRIGIEATDCPP